MTDGTPPTRRKHQPKTGSAKRVRTYGGPRSGGRLQQAIDEAVRREITAALKESDGNVAAASRALGVTEMAMRKRLRSLAIEPDTFRM